ncbi:MAG: PH domain-containing protein [Clostridia bacterium]|nr:PH domain-containing protein [Clostridia bacterium]
MIDFTNKTLIKLKPMELKEGEETISTLLIPDEKVTFAFVSMRDKLIFTDKRIVSVNVQGITGKKIDYTSIPYSKIQVFSIETAGTFDLDSELDVTISGLGTVRFELSAQTDVKELGTFLSVQIL